jgi:hypothetical protein
MFQTYGPGWPAVDATRCGGGGGKSGQRGSETPPTCVADLVACRQVTVAAAAAARTEVLGAAWTRPGELTLHWAAAAAGLPAQLSRPQRPAMAWQVDAYQKRAATTATWREQRAGGGGAVDAALRAGGTPEGAGAAEASGVNRGSGLMPHPADACAGDRGSSARWASMLPAVCWSGLLQLGQGQILGPLSTTLPQQHTAS